MARLTVRATEARCLPASDPGHGARFAVSLPMLETTDAALEVPRMSATILLVEDDPSLLAGRVLNLRSGHRTRTAADGTAALAALESDAPIWCCST